MASAAFAEDWLMAPMQAAAARVSPELAVHADRLAATMDAVPLQDLPDHVAAELEFLDLLIWQHNQAMAVGDAQARQAVEGLRSSFPLGHLGRWLGGWKASARKSIRPRCMSGGCAATPGRADAARRVDCLACKGSACPVACVPPRC